jgi:hypothetical protein
MASIAQVTCAGVGNTLKIALPGLSNKNMTICEATFLFTAKENAPRILVSRLISIAVTSGHI